MKICKCEVSDIEACDCGYVYCGMEDTSKLQVGIYPAIVGCGKQRYKCMNCGGYKQ